MTKIGLLLVATGKYISFVEPLRDSVRKYLFTKKGYEVTIFVFTDSKTVPSGTVRLFQEHKKFPYPTLYRYHMFLKHKKQLANMDYLYYCDVDMKFVDKVGGEIIGDLVATLHPGYYGKGKEIYPYEKNPKSTAFVDNGMYYFCGGFNGGKTKNYLAMAVTLKNYVDTDNKNGLVATWHDESYLNKYLVENPPTKILSPAYCFGDYNLPFKPKILAIVKNDTAAVRYTGLDLLYQWPNWKLRSLVFNTMKLIKSSL